MKRLFLEIKEMLAENGVNDAIAEYKENWYISLNDCEDIYLYVVEVGEGLFGVDTKDGVYSELSSEEVLEILENQL